MHSGSRIALLALCLFAASAVAQHIYVEPATQYANVGAYQTCTAVGWGLNNKTVTFTSSDPTHAPLVGTNPSTANEPATIAIHPTTTGTYTVTASLNGSPSTTGTCTITVNATPTATTGHPRLLITSAMLPGLQAKATSGNPIYQNLLTQANNELSATASHWSTFSTWNGTSCTGYVGPSSTDLGAPYEAYYMAQIALIGPDATTRDTWGCRAHDLFTYYEAALQAGTIVLGGNDWSDISDSLLPLGDWLLSKYLVGSEKTDLHTFLGWMMKDVLVTNTNGCEPSLTATYNSSAQFNTGSVYDYSTQRCMGNNYTQSRLLYLVAGGLTFDDNTTDDPPLTNTCSATRYQVCSDGTAGSLHAYFNFAVGTMLYKYWAHIEDPSVTWQAYNAFFGNLSSQPVCPSQTTGTGTLVPCFGDGRGGESSEGTKYGYSIFKPREAYDMIHTAGYDDPLTWGPQISGSTSSFWDLYAANQLELLVGTSVTGGNTYWNVLTTGDSTSPFYNPYDYYGNSMIMAFDATTGRTDDTALLEWPLLNTVRNGISNWNSQASYGSNAYALLGMFIALPASDPTSSPPADPRPNLPPDFYVGGNQHLYVRSGFSTTDTMVTDYAVNSEIDHEHTFTGGFEVWSKNEWITKRRTEWDDYNNQMSSAQYSNLVAIANSSPVSSSCGTGTIFQWAHDGGGQWWHGVEAGFVTPQHSELPTYASFITNQLGHYNLSPYGDCAGGGANDVNTASRSMIYLRGSNQILFEDRAGTGSARDKSLYMNTTGTPTVSAGTFSWPTTSATQKAYLTSLLPASPTYTATALNYTNDAYLPGGSTNQCWGNGWCDYQIGGIIQVDAGSVTGPTQFLSVLEWGPSGLTKTATSLVQSSSGQGFDCALVGTSLGCFMRSIATFTGVTYPASGATTHYVADLTPNTSYNISGAGAPATATTDNAGVLTFAATGTGNITVSTSALAPPTNLRGVIIFTGSTQIY